jgi:hypothetical protein
LVEAMVGGRDGSSIRVSATSRPPLDDVGNVVAVGALLDESRDVRR